MFDVLLIPNQDSGLFDVLLISTSEGVQTITIAETVTVDDGDRKDFIYKTESEQITVSDAVSATKFLSAHISESVTVTDDTNTQLTLITKHISETVTVSDGDTTYAEALPSDTISVADSVSYSVVRTVVFKLPIYKAPGEFVNRATLLTEGSGNYDVYISHDNSTWEKLEEGVAKTLNISSDIWYLKVVLTSQTGEINMIKVRFG